MRARRAEHIAGYALVGRVLRAGEWLRSSRRWREFALCEVNGFLAAEHGSIGKVEDLIGASLELLDDRIECDGFRAGNPRQARKRVPSTSSRGSPIASIGVL